MIGVYITHPQVRIDPDVAVPEWGLSELGRQRAEAAARNGWVGRLGRVVTSDERKAVETAEILSATAKVSVEIIEDAGENDRSATGFLPPDQFELAADWFFAHPDQSYKGWERAVDAQARIVRAVEKALASHDPAVPIAFVGHGGVGTLLKCHLGGRAIGRQYDQPSGGGNLFSFRLSDRMLVSDWQAMEAWQGP